MAEISEVSIMFALTQEALWGINSVILDNALDNEMLQKVYSLSHKHDIAPIIGYAIGKRSLDIDEQLRHKFQKEQVLAVYRYEQQKYELERIIDVLEQVEIEFVPLKGSIMRRYYPEPWLRTSCDIDILVKESKLDNAVKALKEHLGYKEDGKGSHDISLFSPSNVHIELHYSLVENGRANDSSKLLSNIWDVLTPKCGYGFYYEMSDEMFYFYHIAHMVMHFENGGCGIKPFVDLLILDNIETADKSKRNDVLQQASLLKFANVARKLSRVWLENEAYDDVSLQVESFILKGGVYGTSENQISLQLQKKGGRLKYLFSKVFIPYDTIKFHYPILQKHRWLTPIMEVRRWFKLVFCGHAKRLIRELKMSRNVSTEEAENIQAFLENIGL